MDIVQVIFSNQIIPLELYLAPCPSLAETALRLVAFFLLSIVNIPIYLILYLISSGPLVFNSSTVAAWTQFKHCQRHNGPRLLTLKLELSPLSS